jgi:hypothetical protein
VKQYASIVQRALAKDPNGLRAFLEISAKSPFYGEAGLSYVSRLHHLLKIWGDHDFAAALRHENDAVKQAVTRLLDLCAVNEFPQKFPETSSLQEHK